MKHSLHFEFSVPINEITSFLVIFSLLAEFLGMMSVYFSLVCIIHMCTVCCVYCGYVCACLCGYTYLYMCKVEVRG